MTHSAVGIVGLEPTTTAIAQRLAGAGRRVLVHDRQPERRQPFTSSRQRIEIAGSLADIAAECHDVILWRPNLDTLRQELFGDPDRPGLAHELASDALVIDMSPGLPSVPQRIESLLGQRAIAIVDLSVLAGGPEDAHSGTLDMAIGGQPSSVERAASVLAPLGHLRRTGALGSARSAKIVVGSLRAVIGRAEGEAGALARASCLSEETLQLLLALARQPATAKPADAATCAIEAARAVALAEELGLKVPLASAIVK